MKSGAKRPANSFDSTSSDAELRSKRVDAPTFDVHKAGTTVDVQRANAAYEHVRALNTQFASWIQLKLQNHPDELWEDDVKDYIFHASSIMEKFKDVVDWLRANASNKMSNQSVINSPKNLVAMSGGEKQTSGPDSNNGFEKPVFASNSNFQNLDSQSSGLFSFSQPPSFTGFPSAQKKSVASSDGSKPNAHQDVTNGVEEQVAPGSIPMFQAISSQSSGHFSFSQKPEFFGNRSDTTTKGEAPGDVDEDDEPEPQSSPSLRKAEEKGVIVVYEAKCKFYVKPDDPAEKGWKDMGMGQLSIKCKEGAEKASKDSRPTIIVRNDVGKILLNALIYPGIKMNIQKNTVASIFHTSGGGHEESGDNDVVSRMYLLKMKNVEEASKLASTIKDYAPSE